MSFRIEEKLYIKPEHVLDFREYLRKNSSQKLYHPRKIKSLYFENVNLNMYSDSVEGLVPRKKIRVRNYPNEKDKDFYFRYNPVKQKTKIYIKKDNAKDSPFNILKKISFK